MVRELKNKLTLFSGIIVVLGASFLVVSMLISSITWGEILGAILFLIGTCLMLSTTGNKENISIIFSFLTIIGVVISTLFLILAALGIVEVRTSMFGASGIGTIIFPCILAFTIGSATLTYLTSTISDTGTIKTLRNVVAGLTIGSTIMTLFSLFLGLLALQLLSIVAIAEVVLAVITLFLIVLDKQEALETISILNNKCRELQQQVTKSQQDLETQIKQQQTSQTELEQLRKNNQELQANAEYYNKLYVETKQEALYNQQQLVSMSSQTTQETTVVSTPDVAAQPLPSEIDQNKPKTSPIPMINFENNN